MSCLANINPNKRNDANVTALMLAVTDLDKTRVLLEHGAAAKVNRVEDLPYRLEHLLGTRKLAEMGRAAKALGRPQAARDILNEVVRRTCGAIK